MSATPITHVVPHLCGMARAKRMSRLVMVFRAFFDESGKDPVRNKALVMGGFLGRVEEWLKASDAWDEALHESPRIEYFKSSEATSLTGEFWRWRRIETDKKILSLAKSIAKFDVFGYCITVPHRLFEHHDPKASHGAGTKAYDWGFLAATSGLIQFLDEDHPGDDKVDFVFDKCSELPACIAQYNFLKADPVLKTTMRRAGECSPGDDKEVAALQMADLLSGEFSRHVDGRVMSDALNIIRENNKIGHLPCRPPRQFPDTLRIAKLAKQVHGEAVEYLKKSKIGSTAFASPEDVVNQVLELKMRESYFHLEWGRILLALDDDPDYQAFKKKYSEAHGIEEESE